MKRKLTYFLLPVLLVAGGIHAQNVCSNAGGSNDNPRCNEVSNTYWNGYCQSGHCSYSFDPLPAGYTQISRTASNITCWIDQMAGGTRIVVCDLYDSLNNCVGWMDWTDRFPNWTFPNITGSIPLCPVVGQTYTYSAERWANNNPYGSETLSWAITGGTIQSVTSYSNLLITTDSVKVQWNAAGPHRLICTRSGLGVTTAGSIACSNHDTLWDGVAGPPTIQGPSGLCAGNTVATYTASTFDPAFAYTWSCSNGTITSGQGTASITVTWAGSGILTLTRTATPCGWTDVTSKSVTLSTNAGPNVSLGPDRNPCTGAQVLLDAGPGATYQWSNLWSTRIMLPTTSGTYSVTVTDAGGCRDSDTINVNFSGTLTTSLAPATTVCPGSSLTPGTFSTYLWSTGATTASIVPATNGLYKVTVSNGGCYATDYSFVTLTAGPSASLSPTINHCNSTPLTLNPGSFTSYLWSTGATTQTISPTTSGTYSVTVVNANGCQSIASTVLTMFSAPIPSLGPNQTVCTGTAVTLNPGTFNSYLWSTGATTQTISPTTSGTYSVTVTDANGCTGSDAMTLTILPNPNPTITAIPLTVCAGQSMYLDAGLWAGYLWSTGATTSGITVIPPGTWSVTVTDGTGCTGWIQTNVTALPAPTFSLGADTFLCADTFVTIDGPVGMASYIWSTGALGNSISATTGGTYALTVTDANGCTASDDKVVTALTDCVFPGDANYDGVADNADILAIGAYYGYTGGTRPGATLLWYGQSLPDWGGALPGNADPKHSDCDGNGTVAAVDTQAVTLNYGLLHSKGAGITGGPVQLMLRALSDSVYPGDPAWFVVEMGDAQNVADSVYGIALRLSLSGIAMAAPGIQNVDYTNCWFASGTDRLDFTQTLGSSASVDLAVVRNDQNEQSGFGEVFRFAVGTDANLVQVRDVLQVSLSNVLFVDANLTPMPLTLTNGSVVVSHLVTGLPTSAIRQPVVYPNPTNGVVRIYCIGANALEVVAVDALGQVVKTKRNETGNSLVMETHDLASGIYLLRIKTESGTFMKRLVVE